MPASTELMKRRGGRPMLPVELRRVNINATVAPETRRTLMHLSEERGVAVSVLIDEAVEILAAHASA